MGFDHEREFNWYVAATATTTATSPWANDDG